VNLKLPPLRERPGDVVALADHFVAKYAKANGIPPRALTQQARDALLRAPWPGNVRELENTLHRAVLLSQGDQIGPDAIVMPDGVGLSDVVRTASLATQAAQVADTISRSMVGRTVADVERDLILETLDHMLGNRTHAANILGISIRTLRNKLNQYTDEGTSVPGPGEQRKSA
jgi:two-component system response regulator FlrC